ncbi:hypothetical protein EDD22DRAFT_884876 [Suillus occidentalis]|nr:hypothetical protein EDD22DRAFT_884876 [Suillus occidentalis]
MRGHLTLLYICQLTSRIGVLDAIDGSPTDLQALSLGTTPRETQSKGKRHPGYSGLWKQCFQGYSTMCSSRSQYGRIMHRG